MNRPQIEFHDDKAFASAAAMRAHYAAIRDRLNPRPPPKPKPLPLSARVLEQAEERRALQLLEPTSFAAARARRALEQRKREDAAKETRRRELLRDAQVEVNEARTILIYAAAELDADLAALRTGVRTRSHVEARYVAAYCMLEWFGRGTRSNPNNSRSLCWIGRRIGRDHTMVLYGDERVKESPRLLQHAQNILESMSEKKRGPYVSIESYRRVDPEAYTLKRSAISASI